MKAISVYALTREQNIHHLQKLERQLSERDYFLKIKEWELNSMKGLVKQLEGHMKEVYALRFFYSFQIPKLGKEFDLLQIKEGQILNLELSPIKGPEGNIEYLVHLKNHEEGTACENMPVDPKAIVEQAHQAL